MTSQLPSMTQDGSSNSSSSKQLVLPWWREGRVLVSLVALMTAAIGVRLGSVAASQTLPLYASMGLGFDNASIARLFTLRMIGVLVAVVAMAGLSKRFSARSLVTVCLLLGGAGNVLTGLAPTPLFLFLVPCTAGLTALTYVNLNTMAQFAAPGHDATVNALYRSSAKLADLTLPFAAAFLSRKAATWFAAAAPAAAVEATAGGGVDVTSPAALAAGCVAVFVAVGGIMLASALIYAAATGSGRPRSSCPRPRLAGCCKVQPSQLLAAPRGAMSLIAATAGEIKTSLSHRPLLIVVIALGCITGLAEVISGFAGLWLTHPDNLGQTPEFHASVVTAASLLSLLAILLLGRVIDTWLTLKTTFVAIMAGQSVCMVALGGLTWSDPCSGTLPWTDTASTSMVCGTVTRPRIVAAVYATHYVLVQAQAGVSSMWLARAVHHQFATGAGDGDAVEQRGKAPSGAVTRIFVVAKLACALAKAVCGVVCGRLLASGFAVAVTLPRLGAMASNLMRTAPVAETLLADDMWHSWRFEPSLGGELVEGGLGLRRLFLLCGWACIPFLLMLLSLAEPKPPEAAPPATVASKKQQ